MPLYSLNPSNIFKFFAARSRSALLHKIIAELDFAERRAKSPQDLPGEWQSPNIEPITVNLARGAWRLVRTAQPECLVRLRNNHVVGRGFATQEVWIQSQTRELYIEIGIQGIRIRIDGTWVAKIVRRVDPHSGRETIKLTGQVEHSAAHMNWLANSLTAFLAPLKSVIDTSDIRAARGRTLGSQFVTIRRQPGQSTKSGSRVIHLP